MIVPQRYHLGIVLNKFYFPLTVPDLYRTLRSKKFSISPSAEPLPTGIRRYMGGTLAQRNHTFFSVYPERKLFGLDSDSIEALTESLSDIIDVVKEDFGVDMAKDVEYVEVIADMVVVTDKDPVETISKLTTKANTKFDEIMGSETAPRLFSISPKNKTPNSPNWFEIQISPRLSQPNKEYYLNIIFRNQKFSAVKDFLGKINEKVLSLIKAIE